MWLIAALAFSPGCGDESGTVDDKGPGDDTTGDTTEDTGTETDTDTETETDTSEATNGCDELYAFASEDCEMNPIDLVIVRVMCNNLDGVFIDSFMADATKCLADQECEELEALLELRGDTEVDTDAPPNGLEECMFEAAASAEPEEPNLEFQAHACEYLIECDPEVTSEEACAASFESQELGIFLVVDDPYLSDADACVNPLPSQCDQEEMDACLEGVREDIMAEIKKSPDV